MVGDQGDPVPGGKILHSDLRIVQHGGQVKASELATEMIEHPNLFVRFHFLLYRRKEYRFIIASGNFPFSGNTQNIVGQVVYDL